MDHQGLSQAAIPVSSAGIKALHSWTVLPAHTAGNSMQLQQSLAMMSSPVLQMATAVLCGCRKAPRGQKRTPREPWRQLTKGLEPGLQSSTLSKRLPQ